MAASLLGAVATSPAALLSDELLGRAVQVARGIGSRVIRHSYSLERRDARGLIPNAWQSRRADDHNPRRSRPTQDAGSGRDVRPGDVRSDGREEIREFYEWRARQTGSKAVRQLGVSGVKAVRHLITNLYVASSSERCATVLGIVSFYGGVTYPTKRQSTPPIMVADLITECVLSKDNAWRFKSHTLRPVFMSDAPPSMVIDPHFLKQT